MEPDDIELSMIADEMDIVLQGIAIKHKMSPLDVCAVMIARMIHFSKLTDSSEDLGKLLSSVSKSIANKEFDKPRNIH